MIIFVFYGSRQTLTLLELYLSFIDRPKVTVSPELREYYVIENTTNVQLACVVREANPVAKSYRWYKNNASISNGAVFTIASVHTLDSGSYTCDATNAVGTSTQSFAIQLIILCKHL